eukprot:353491-Prorocentrum_minimum.AAC.1
MPESASIFQGGTLEGSVRQGTSPSSDLNQKKEKRRTGGGEGAAWTGSSSTAGNIEKSVLSRMSSAEETLSWVAVMEQYSMRDVPLSSTKHTDPPPPAVLI